MGFFFAYETKSRRPFQRQELIFGNIRRRVEKGGQNIGVVEERNPLLHEKYTPHTKLAIFLKSQNFL